MSLELLLDRLAKHQRVRRMLDETTNLPTEELVESLLKEFEQIVERYKSLSTFAGEARRLAAAKLPAQLFLPSQETPGRVPVHRAASAPHQTVQPVPQKLEIEPIRIALPSIDLKQAEDEFAAKKAGETRRMHLRNELESVEQVVQAEIERDWGNKVAEHHDRIVQLKHSQQLLRSQPEPVRVEEAPSVEPVSVPSSRLNISDEDLLYIHGASLAGNQADDQHIHEIENLKGFDGVSSVLNVRSGDVSVFISKVERDELNVTRSGILLLNKEDSIRYREAHETLLNELRIREMMMPFEFGSVVRGKEELVQMVRASLPRLRSAIESEGESTSWSLKLLALDARVSRTISEQLPAIKVQERGKDVKRPSKRSDVKSLEKLLQHERGVAETIHTMLTGLSTSSEVAMLINIGNGTSEDWKLILDASYTIPIINRANFFSNVFELQEQYRKKGMMFEVHGPSGRFSATADARMSHAISA